MNEPKYDEDVVNLGYLNKIISQIGKGIKIDIPINVSRHYATRPSPPYYAGDTWIDGDIIYTCIKTREIGVYTSSDWATESGAKKEAEEKNRIFLTQPYNYKLGDMWILQSDEDHKAGKKGEILIAIAGKTYYDENDWINMLGYGTIRSINEVANNISDALNRINATKEEGKVTIFFDFKIPTTAIPGDLWYVTDNIDTYIKENVYKFTGEEWEQIQDNLAIVAFEEANIDRLVGDGKIQSFYEKQEPIENISVGDIWTNTNTKKLYRYNGTNWVAVYDPNLKELRQDLETITETTTKIETDLGKITQEVGVIETKLVDLGYRDEIEGITELYISNAGEGYLLKLIVQGSKNYKSDLFPRKNLYPRTNLYPNQKGG